MKVFVNLLTLIRLLATFILPIVWKLFTPFWILVFVALILFTDFLDGFLARRFKVSTLLGSILDCFADKLFGIAIILIIATYYKSFYLVLMMELFIALINIVAAFRGAKTKSSLLGRAKMWVLGLAIIMGMVSIFKYNLLNFIKIEVICDWLVYFFEYEDTVVLFGAAITVGSQIMVAVDYLIDISKDLKNNKKVKYDFKSNKEILSILVDSDYYLKHKNYSLAQHFLKNS